MRVALLTEGTYPFHQGGVSVWCDQLVRGLSRHRFDVHGLCATGAEHVVWKLPRNVDSVTRASRSGGPRSCGAPRGPPPARSRRCSTGCSPRSGLRATSAPSPSPCASCARSPGPVCCARRAARRRLGRRGAGLPAGELVRRAPRQRRRGRAGPDGGRRGRRPAPPRARPPATRRRRAGRRRLPDRGERPQRAARAHGQVG